jgi:hypothetical protein
MDGELGTVPDLCATFVPCKGTEAVKVRLMAIAAAPQLTIDHRVVPQTLWLSQ